MEGLSEVLVLEELDPVIEKELLRIVGKYHLPVTIRGKLTQDTRNAGENSVESVRRDLAAFLPQYPELVEGGAVHLADRTPLPFRCARRCCARDVPTGLPSMR